MTGINPPPITSAELREAHTQLSARRGGSERWGALLRAANRIDEQDAEIARLRAEVEAAKGMTVHILADNERLCELVKDLQPKVCGIDQSPCPNAPCDGCVPNLTVKLEHEEGQVDRLNGLLVEQYNTCRCRVLTAQLALAKNLIRFPPSSLLDDGGWLERCNKFIRDTNND